ncbi:unnamed protein product, partial [Hapterophycus canaliculatus]
MVVPSADVCLLLRRLGFIRFMLLRVRAAQVSLEARASHTVSHCVFWNSHSGEAVGVPGTQTTRKQERQACFGSDRVHMPPRITDWSGNMWLYLGDPRMAPVPWLDGGQLHRKLFTCFFGKEELITSEELR